MSICQPVPPVISRSPKKVSSSLGHLCRDAAGGRSLVRLDAVNRLAAPLVDGRGLAGCQRLEEVAANVVRVAQDGVLGCAATLGGQADPGAAAVGLVVG